VHYFDVPEPGKLVGKINWRIRKPNQDFIERATVQTFRQDASNPGLLANRGNEYLHYEDDWYILASKPDK
jgi:violaxanthin de-epoxidase